MAVPWYALTAAIVQASRSSTRVTPAPAATIVAAARHADSTSGKARRRTTACSGMPWSRSVSSVITPSVPSEPISSPSRSYPADVFGARLPARTTRPPGSTASSASVLARIFP